MINNSSPQKKYQVRNVFNILRSAALQPSADGARVNYGSDATRPSLAGNETADSHNKAKREDM